MLKSFGRPIAAFLRRFGLQIARTAPPAPSIPADIDPLVQRIIAEVRPFTMTSPERLNAMCEAVRHIQKRKVAGAIVECGVWRGGSIMAAAKTLQSLATDDRDLYLFDTFSGMTPPSDADVSLDGSPAGELLAAAAREEGYSVWAWASLADVRHNMASTGYSPDRIHYIEGRVEDTVPSRAPDQIALLRLDTDWYESTAHELRHLVSRMADGAVLIIDDYGHWQGARRAVDEFLGRLEPPVLLHRVDYTGRVAIISRA